MTTGAIDQPRSLRRAHGRNREQTHKHQTHAHDAGGKTRLKATSNHPRVEAKRRLAGGACAAGCNGCTIGKFGMANGMNAYGVVP